MASTALLVKNYYDAQSRRLQLLEEEKERETIIKLMRIQSKIESSSTHEKELQSVKCKLERVVTCRDEEIAAKIASATMLLRTEFDKEREALKDELAAKDLELRNAIVNHTELSYTVQSLRIQTNRYKVELDAEYDLHRKTEKENKSLKEQLKELEGQLKRMTDAQSISLMKTAANNKAIDGKQQSEPLKRPLAIAKSKRSFLSPTAASLARQSPVTKRLESQFSAPAASSPLKFTFGTPYKQNQQHESNNSNKSTEQSSNTSATQIQTPTRPALLAVSAREDVLATEKTGVASTLPTASSNAPITTSTPSSAIVSSSRPSLFDNLSTNTPEPVVTKKRKVRELAHDSESEEEMLPKRRMPAKARVLSSNLGRPSPRRKDNRIKMIV